MGFGMLKVLVAWQLSLQVANSYVLVGGSWHNN